MSKETTLINIRGAWVELEPEIPTRVQLEIK